MGKLFIPYSENQPATLDIKGHRVLILTSSSDDMEDDLVMLGGDSIRELDCTDAEPSHLMELAASIKGGVVLTPPGIPISVLITSLEQELPWIH